MYYNFNIFLSPVAIDLILTFLLLLPLGMAMKDLTFIEDGNSDFVRILFCSFFFFFFSFSFYFTFFFDTYLTPFLSHVRSLVRLLYH